MLDPRAHTFTTVYRLRGYTRAAEELHLSQPAVSQQIRQIERHYNCRLFRRTGRGIEPTPAGDVLYRALTALEHDERRLREELEHADAKDADAAPLRFGCTRTIADCVAPRLLARHRLRHPDERLLMRSGNTRELIQQIDAGEIDFALVEGSFDRARFDSAPLSREPYIAVAAHGEAPASIRDLLGYQLVLREPGSGTREILEQNLAARELVTDDFAGTVERASIPAIKALVREGAGVTFLSRVAVERELAEGALADVTPRDFAIEHDFSLIWERGSRYAERWRSLLRAWRDDRG